MTIHSLPEPPETATDNKANVNSSDFRPISTKPASRAPLYKGCVK